MRAWILLGALLVVFGCATSPLGRKQLILLPESQMDAMGVQSFQQVKQQTPVDSDPAINAYVRCVALPITRAAANQIGNTNWEIVVFQDPTANAFALPGGKIGVNSGLMKVAKTDAELAAVIGHEVGHVIAKHGNERVSQSVVAEFGQTALGGLMSSNPHRDLIMAAAGVGAQVGVLLPFSRTQEDEADLIGLDLMARAGFDPHASIDLWKNMMAQEKGAPPEFLSTHPASKNRINSLESNMSNAVAKYQKANNAGQHPQCRMQ